MVQLKLLPPSTGKKKEKNNFPFMYAISKRMSACSLLSLAIREPTKKQRSKYSQWKEAESKMHHICSRQNILQKHSPF